MKTLPIENREDIEEVINRCDVCYVGVIDTQNNPYVLPMNFGYSDGYIYLHGANFGELIDSLRKNPNVCITFCTPSSLTWQDSHVACSYRVKAQSVVARGMVEFVTDYDQKVEALDILMNNYSERKFKYNTPAVINVEVYKVKVEEITGKAFGVPHNKKFPWESKQ